MSQTSPENASQPLTWRTAVHKDLLASVVVFLVALPLCMGVAIASGVPVAAGLFTGIVAGIVVGALAGCPLQVSGPAAGLAVIVYGIVERFGFELLGVVVLIAGIMQMAAGALRLGLWFRAVSPAVIKGMLAGIGVLIFASQFHVMLDVPPKDNTLKNLASIPDSIAKAFTQVSFSTARQRAFRLQHLRLVGGLRDRQVEINDEVVKQLPSEDAAEPEDLAGELEQRIKSRPQEIVQLAEKQHEIAETLKRINNAVIQGERDIDTQRSRDIVSALNATDEKMSMVVRDLRTGDLLAAVQSQAEVVEAFDQYLATLKNHGLAAQLGLLTIAVIVLWPVVTPKRLKAVPGPLVAVVAATAAAAILHLPVVYVDIPGNVFGEINFPSWDLVREESWTALLQAAFALAAVASAETLLCATATDQMHAGPRTKYNKELFAQGVGNTICGVIGALPMTGVIVRSTANIESGGRSRLSAILHGVWLLLFLAFLSPMLRMIPTSALAAILVYTGYRLMNPKSVMELAQFGRSEVAIFAVTVLTIVVVDLLTGIVVGVVLALIKLLNRFSRLKAELQIDADRKTADLTLSGSATFLGLPKLAAALEEVPAESRLRVHFRDLYYVDHACIDMLSNWSNQHEQTGGAVQIDWTSLQNKYDTAEEPQP